MKFDFEKLNVYQKIFLVLGLMLAVVIFMVDANAVNISIGVILLTAMLVFLLKYEIVGKALSIGVIIGIISFLGYRGFEYRRHVKLEEQREFQRKANDLARQFREAKEMETRKAEELKRAEEFKRKQAESQRLYQAEVRQEQALINRWMQLIGGESQQQVANLLGRPSKASKWAYSIEFEYPNGGSVEFDENGVIGWKQPHWKYH